MARSARRRSAPSSPAKTKSTAKPNTQTRQAARAAQEQAVEDVATTRNVHANQQTENEDIVEGDTTGSANYIPDQYDQETDPDDVSSTAASSVGESYDLNEIQSSIKRVNNLADIILDQFEQSSLPDLAAGVHSDGSVDLEFIQGIGWFHKSCRAMKATDTFINLSKLKMYIENGHRKPFHGVKIIALKINLVLLLLKLAGYDADGNVSPARSRECIQYLARSTQFPQDFDIQGTAISEESKESRRHWRKMGHMEASLRTQYFLNELGSSKTRNAMEALRILELAFPEKARDRFSGPSDVNLSQYSQRQVKRRYESLIEQCSEGTTVNVAALREQYPLEGFFDQVSEWVKIILSSLYSALERAHGVLGVVKELSAPHIGTADVNERERAERKARKDKEKEWAEKQRPGINEWRMEYDLNEAAVESQGPAWDLTLASQVNQGEVLDSDPMEEPPIRMSGFPDTIQESPVAGREPSPEIPERSTTPLREITQQFQHDTVDVPEVEVESHLLFFTSKQHEEVPRGETPEPDHALTARLMANQKRQALISNKENRPVQVDGSSSAVTGPGESWQPPRGKKRQLEVDDDDDDEEAFEAAPSSWGRVRPSSGKQRARDPSTTPQPDDGVLRFDDDEHDHGIAPREVLVPVRNRREGSAGPSQHHRPASTQPAYRAQASRPSIEVPSTAPDSMERSTGQSLAYQHWQMASQRARQRPTQERNNPRTRSAWTASECNRLIDLLQKIGAKWSLMKARDKDPKYYDEPELSARDQVGLKDKARNMKYDFLKADKEVPWWLDDVTVGPRLIGMLSSEQRRRLEG